MNNLKHLDLPHIAASQMVGEEWSIQRGAALRKLYLHDDRIVGYRLLGDLSEAGISRTLMNERLHVRWFKHRLLRAGSGMGVIEGLALSPQIVM